MGAVVRHRARQYIRSTASWTAAMPRAKNQTLTLRTTREIKDLLRMAAEREHRSVASMVEILVLEYARQAKLSPPSQKKAAT